MDPEAELQLGSGSSRANFVSPTEAPFALTHQLKAPDWVPESFPPLIDQRFLTPWRGAAHRRWDRPARPGPGPSGTALPGEHPVVAVEERPRAAAWPCRDRARAGGGVRSEAPSPGPALERLGSKPSERAGAITSSRRRAAGGPGRCAPDGTGGAARPRSSTGPPAIETDARRLLAQGPFHLDASLRADGFASAQSCSASTRCYLRTQCTNLRPTDRCGEMERKH